jgi:hypothetical protein
MNQALIDYVKKRLGEGISENKLRGILADSKWPDSDINAAFNLAKAEVSVPIKVENKLQETSAIKHSPKKKIWYISAGILALIVIIFSFSSCPTEKASPQAEEPAKEEATEEKLDEDKVFETYISKITVYLENNKFKEAKETLLETKLKLAEIETRKGIDEKEKLALKELLNAFDDFIDARELMSRKDFLTLSPYTAMIEKLTEARNHFAEAQNIGKQDLSKEIKDMDSTLAQLASEEMLMTVITNSYISKIDTESVRDLAIEIVKNNCGIIFTECETEEEKSEALYNYVRDNIMYVSDPNGFTYKSLDYIQDPSTTLKRKAGDCEDHAVLLNSLFEAVGISSGFCFGDTYGKTSDISKMNHAFSTVIKDGQYIFADAVCKHSSIGETCFPGISSACFFVADFRQKMDQIISQA